MIDELRPVFATLRAERDADGADADGLAAGWRCPRASPSSGSRERSRCGARSATGAAMREAQRQARAARATARGRGPSRCLRREDTERAFLALCIASPEEGAQALASLDVDEHFSSELLRRAARAPARGRPARADGRRARRGGALEDDPELKGLLAELVVEAGRDEAHPAMLEVQRLQLELARVDRQIQRARGRAERRRQRARASSGQRSSASSTARTGGCWRRRGRGSRQKRCDVGTATALARGDCVPKRRRQCGAWIATILEQMLGEGLSLAEIGRRFERARIDGRVLGRAAWASGANGRERHAARGGLARGATGSARGRGDVDREIADGGGRSKATVRHWLRRARTEDAALGGRRPREAIVAARTQRSDGRPSVVCRATARPSFGSRQPAATTAASVPGRGRRSPAAGAR